MSVHELFSDLSIWQALTALSAVMAALLAAIWRVGMAMTRQTSADLKQRFETAEGARTEAQKLWSMRFEPIERHIIEEPKRWAALEEQVALVREEMTGRELRVVRIEEEIKHLPSRTEFLRLHERIDSLAAAVHLSSGKLDELVAIRATMVRINDYLLAQK